MMNKKGTLVLRDIVFMMLIVSAIFVFAGIFVSDMADNYSNTNMSDEWAVKQTNTLSDSMLTGTHEDMEAQGQNLKGTTGIISFLGDTLVGMGKILMVVVNAPGTIGDLVTGTLDDMGVSPTIIVPLRILITAILWAIVIFTIISAFLKGGKI